MLRSKLRRIAPFGNEVLAKIHQGINPDVWVIGGSTAHVLAENHRRTHGRGTALILPEGSDPRELRWPMPPGHVPFVFWPFALRPELEMLAAVLLGEGAQEVSCYAEFEQDRLLIVGADV